MIPQKYLLNLIETALQEDVGDGDHTSLSCFPPDSTGKAKIIAKQSGIIAGVLIAEKVFKYCSEKIRVKINKNDGEFVNHGDLILHISGPKIKILEAERTALNFLQRLSGIATETHKYAEKIKGLNTKILDTRKTTPGLRLLEKYAVKTGGGENHRIGLYDMIMLKDNHIDFAGGVRNAINNANDYLKKKNKKLKIVIEVRNIAELEQVIATGNINRIMLDNFSIDETEKAVKIINKRYEIESSGNITLNNVREYAECGVDYISVGAITHQIKSLDLSLKAI